MKLIPPWLVDDENRDSTRRVSDEILRTLQEAEAAIAPLRERAVLAEAVCEAVLDTMDVFTPENVKAAVEEWRAKCRP